MFKEKILIIEDEERIRRLIKDYLNLEGYETIEASDGKEGLDKINDEIDLVILDVMLPIYDGWTILREIRKNYRVPVIMLTARDDESDVLFGYELGTDEYVTKPFSPRVLVAKIKSLLRRVKNNKDEILSYNSLKIDRIAHKAYIEEDEIELTPKEFELLEYFVKNEGRALTREIILNNVWGYDYYGDARTVDTHVKRLRSKLKNESELIKTIRGVGYRFEVNK